jgi:soluble lytic murein transglycosylase-like protein
VILPTPHPRRAFPSFDRIVDIAAALLAAVSALQRLINKSALLSLPASGGLAGSSFVEPFAYCLTALLTFQFPPSAQADPITATVVAPASSSEEARPYASFVADAARQFNIPEHWIDAVIRVESNGNAHAVSSRGALGLMQIMPETWRELSARFDLGIDPFDPRDNIIAGTAYLRQMLDRFGSEGFLAAYNAGPRRYEEHLATGQPLPGETLDYAATLASLIGIKLRDVGRSTVEHVISSAQESIFVERSGDDGARPARRSVSANSLALVPRAAGLFVPRSNEVPFR